MNRSTKARARSGLAFALMLGAALLAGVPTAAATHGGPRDSAGSGQVRQAAGWYDCHAGEMCLFVHAGGEGGGFAWSTNGYNSDFRSLLCGVCNGGDFDDDATSWWNRTGQNFCVSDGYRGGDPDNTMPAGTSGNFTPDWNDRASSIGYQGCP